MLRALLHRFLATAVAACLCLGGAANAQNAGPRLALVIGNAQYADPLATAANDAGLVAETLRGAGFDVTGAANLDQDLLRRASQDFLAKATQAGPDAVVFVYLAGRGLQYEGENYFAPVDAILAHDTDIPLQALRVSDFTRALAAVPLRARIIVLDAARGNHYAPGGNLAGGLALVDADPGALYAFNAAPGTIAPDEPGPYGAYAQALAEMLRQGGVPIDVAFAQARLRANEATQGAVTPWDAANIAPPLVLLAAAPNAPAGASVSYAAAQSRPIASFPAGDAYAAALERDTLQGYQDFLVAYPNDPLAGRVRALLAARREALTWRRSCAANTPGAYWSYMRRYPKGPHFWDARRRLVFLSAPPEPPPEFDVYDFGGLPPPSPTEVVIIERPVLIFDPGFYPPPPPPPVFFLQPRPVAFVDLPPPPPPQGQGFLPIPIPIPVPVPFGHFSGPAGRVVQQNFGQQGAPGGPGAAPGQAAPAAGQPTTPAAPAAPAAAPAAPNHVLPQGAGLPPVAPHAHTPGAAAPAAAPAANPATPAVAPPAATPPAAAPHALPQGVSLPPVPPSMHAPAATGAGARAPGLQSPALTAPKPASAAKPGAPEAAPAASPAEPAPPKPAAPAAAAPPAAPKPAAVKPTPSTATAPKPAGPAAAAPTVAAPTAPKPAAPKPAAPKPAAPKPAPKPPAPPAASASPPAPKPQATAIPKPAPQPQAVRPQNAAAQNAGPPPQPKPAAKPAPAPSPASAPKPPPAPKPAPAPSPASAPKPPPAPKPAAAPKPAPQKPAPKKPGEEPAHP